MWHAENLLTSLYRASSSSETQFSPYDTEVENLIDECTKMIHVTNASIEEWKQFLATAEATELWTDLCVSKFCLLHRYMEYVQKTKDPAMYERVYEHLLGYVSNEMIGRPELSELLELCKRTIEFTPYATRAEWKQFLTTAKNTVSWETAYNSKAIKNSQFENLVAYMRDVQQDHLPYYANVRNHLLASVQNKTIDCVHFDQSKHTK